MVLVFRFLIHLLIVITSFPMTLLTVTWSITKEAEFETFAHILGTAYCKNYNHPQIKICPLYTQCFITQ
jgi:hypothetical protein